MVGLDGEGEAAQAVGAAHGRAPGALRRVRPPRRARDRRPRRRPATPTVARCWASSAFVCERMSSRASSAAVTAGRTERSQSTSRPCRRVRAIRRPTRIAARAMTTARRTQPHVLELDVRLGGRRRRGGGVRRGRGRMCSCRRGGRKRRRGRRRGRRGHRGRGRRCHGGRGRRVPSWWSCPGRRRFPTGRRAASGVAGEREEQRGRAATNLRMHAAQPTVSGRPSERGPHGFAVTGRPRCASARPARSRPDRSG